MRSSFILSTIFVTILSSYTHSADWPQFRGPDRTGISRETGLLKKWPDEGPRMLWSFDKLPKGYASMSIADGMLYTTGVDEDKVGYIYAFGIDGKPRWKRPYGEGWTGSYPGSRTCPTIDDGKLYVMSGHAKVSCFDAKTGTPIWTVDAMKKFNGENIRWGIAESVLIDGKMVICTPGGKNATVVALDKADGSTIWTSKDLSEKSAYCSPLVVDRGPNRVLITMIEKSIVGLDIKNGDLLWQIPHKTSYDISAVSPVYYDGYLCVTNGYRKGSFGFQLSPDGTKIKKVWEQKALDVHHGGVIQLDGKIHGASTKGKWICLDIKTGQVLYQADNVGKGSVIYADGMLYGYGERGTLGLIKPTENGYEMVSSFKITMGEKEHWAHPVISDGVLYVRHGSALMAFDIKQ